MVIVWGTINAGKVDEVPGQLFHVMTQFGHVYYIPLIPTGSFVVLEKTADGGFRGAPIPLSFKSILAGWLRGGSIVAILGSIVATAIMLLDPKAAPFAWILPVLIGLAAVTALILSYQLRFFTEATYERAKELAQHAGLSDTGLLMLEVSYGRLTAEQADAELARREEQLATANSDVPVAAQLADPQPAGEWGQ
jgi:hypothetical protein